MEHIYGVRNHVHAKNRRQEETMGEQKLTTEKEACHSVLPAAVHFYFYQIL